MGASWSSPGVRGTPMRQDATLVAWDRQVRPGSDEWLWDMVGGIGTALLRVFARLAWCVWSFPITVALLVVAGAAYWFDVWVAAMVATGLLAALTGLLALLRRALFLRRLWRPAARYRIRRRLARRWRRLVTVVRGDLVEHDRATGVRTSWTPSLSRLRWVTTAVLRGRVTLPPGQVVEDFAALAPYLAAAVGARWCRVRAVDPARPRRVEVRFLFGDPLAELVTPLPVDDGVDLAAVPVGIREDGSLWLLRLIGTHFLIAGVTGAGKGSVVWSLLRGVAALIRSGVVQVWAVDGKAGMELAPGRALFSRFATTPEDGVQLLEDAADFMRDRAERLAGDVRTHTPTATDPLLLVVVDEVALLTAYLPDRALKARAEKALSVIATQGRAPGVVLVAALQDPRKEVLNLRNLFPTKIGMRLDEKTQVDMVLGEGARDAGADCHQIPDTTPGVAYVKVDGRREPVRVRASYLDDSDLADLAREYSAPRLAPVVEVPVLVPAARPEAVAA